MSFLRYFPLLLSAAFFLITNDLQAAEPKSADAAEQAAFSYKPAVHGSIRTRWEGEWHDSDFANRFQVRNARLSVSGNILPDLTYFLQADFCQAGKFKFLDAYARWQFLPRWRVQAGQFRIPFGCDVFRASPQKSIFGNRSFVAKHLLNMRQVGVKAGYYGRQKYPLTLEAGLFNSTDMYDQSPWQSQLTFASKGEWKIKNISLSASYASVVPKEIRANCLDGSLTWQSGRWLVEGEYAWKHFTRKMFRNISSYNFFVDYSIPVRIGSMRFVSVQGRFDGMTDCTTGAMTDSGLMLCDAPGRKRVTVGGTIGVIRLPLQATVKLNYEHYFYDCKASAVKGQDSKLLAELTVSF